MKIAVGLSGGVDSSVSAFLLKQQGFEVIGIFMKNWEEDDTDTYCSAAQDRKDAEHVAHQLGIPFHTVNFASEYWDFVFETFLAEYQSGRTPNPDILCNKEIKFKAFLNYAKTLGADKIATGHYARIEIHHEGVALLKGLDPNKDQSYFLHALKQAEFSQVLFPVGSLLKPDVRKIAAEQCFENATKKDSTGICFIGERKFKAFLSEYLPAQPGNIVTETGRVIGQHNGLMYYTIGQRQGIGIGGHKEGSGNAWYVAEKDVSTNELIVVQGQNHPLLFKSTLKASQLTWIANAPPSLNGLKAKIRYRQVEQACEIETVSRDQINVYFQTTQRAITPGQSIVFYSGDVCLGGAVIVS